MFNDVYYIRSLVATLIVAGILLTVLFFAAYMTGIVGLAVLSIVLLIFFAFLYGWWGRLAGKGLPETKNIAQCIKERL